MTWLPQSPFQSGMSSVPIIVIMKIDELSLQVGCVQNHIRSRYSRCMVPVSRSMGPAGVEGIFQT